MTSYPKTKLSLQTIAHNVILILNVYVNLDIPQKIRETISNDQDQSIMIRISTYKVRLRTLEYNRRRSILSGYAPFYLSRFYF